MSAAVRRTALVATIALACATAAVGMSPSAAGVGSASKSYRVQGMQKAVGTSPGLYTMQSDTGHAGLVGDWAITPKAHLVSPPWYFETGTEQFNGCLDTNGDHSCKGEPAGTISFNYAAWLKFDVTATTFTELAGGCVHPITGGTDDFQRVKGLLTMRDTPLDDGTIKTSYRGTVTLSAKAGAAATEESLPSATPDASIAADATTSTSPRVC